MTPERWQQIKIILDEALECDPAERAALLNRACADNAELRSAVESLLAYQGQAQSFIEAPAHEAVQSKDQTFATNALLGHSFTDDPVNAPTRSDTPITPHPWSRFAPGKGQRIGPYRVLREVGRGGM